MKFIKKFLRELNEEFDDLIDLLLQEEKEDEVSKMPLLLSKKKSYFTADNKKAA